MTLTLSWLHVAALATAIALVTWLFSRVRIRLSGAETPITAEALEERLGWMRANGDKAPSTLKALEGVLEEVRTVSARRTKKEAPGG